MYDTKEVGDLVAAYLSSIKDPASGDHEAATHSPSHVVGGDSEIALDHLVTAYLESESRVGVVHAQIEEDRLESQLADLFGFDQSVDSADDVIPDEIGFEIFEELSSDPLPDLGHFIQEITHLFVGATPG